MTTHRFLLLVVLSGLLGGCKDERLVPLQPFSGRIVFAIDERYADYGTPSDPLLAITMQTQQIYPCANYHIDHTITQTGSALEVDITGIRIPQVCLTALGPATGQSFLSLTRGIHTLTVRMGNLRDRYTLTITDSTICLSAINTVMTQPDDSLRWRYPNRSMAYLCGAYTGYEYLCSAFQESLGVRFGFPVIALPADGRWPYPIASAGHYYDMPGHYYRYSSESDFDSAGEMLHRFTDKFLRDKPGMGLELISWRNKHFMSWMYPPRASNDHANWYGWEEGKTKQE